MNALKSLITICLLSCATLLFDVSTSHASTATTTFAVSATVASACSVTALPLAFGTYVPTATSATNATTSVTVLCTVGTPYNVGLNAGTGTGATVTTRQMTITGGGTSEMAYSLYQDSGHSVLWGNTVGTNTVSGTYALGQAALTVYGQIPALQSATVGTYSDTITVTITY